jgi:hypothetical protein
LRLNEFHTGSFKNLNAYERAKKAAIISVRLASARKHIASAMILKPCAPSLWRFLFLRISKLMAQKQGRCTQKASAGKEIQPELSSSFRKMRRVNRAPSRAPLQRNHPVRKEKKSLPARPKK